MSTGMRVDESAIASALFKRVISTLLPVPLRPLTNANACIARADPALIVLTNNKFIATIDRKNLLVDVVHHCDRK